MVERAWEVTGAAAPPARLELRGIEKRFPGVRALAGISLSVDAGEVVAIVGENGAGKSTLLRIINGDLAPDAGEISLGGIQAHLASPRDAREAGIRVIYQEPELADELTVAENLFLGELDRVGRSRLVRRSAVIERSRDVIARFDFADELDPRVPVGRLAPPQRQLVEIVKALRADVRVLALDEPTSSLSQREATQLFDTLRTLRTHGVATLYVSHRLREVLALADRVAVLRDGELVGLLPTGEASEDKLVRLMVGRPLQAAFQRPGSVRREVCLEAERLGTSMLKDISFRLHRGEVLGIAGLVGAGRTELARSLYGLDSRPAGRVLVDGVEVIPADPGAALAAGLCLTPEDRKREGLVLTRSIRENITLSVLKQIRAMRVFVRGALDRAIARRHMGSLGIKAPSPEALVATLSGGNQQKVVLARALARTPKVLILDEPTRGIDVASKLEIYKLIGQLADDGHGVIFISSELPEILAVSDRILVLAGGRVAGVLSREQATEEKVLSLAMRAGPPAPADPSGGGVA